MQQLVRQYAADGLSDLTPEELAGVPGPRRWLTGFYFALVTVRGVGWGRVGEEGEALQAWLTGWLVGSQDLRWVEGVWGGLCSCLSHCRSAVHLASS